jgi:Ca2+-binding EF-hand superfamily protein
LLLAGGVSSGGAWAADGRSLPREQGAGSAAVLFAPSRPVFLRLRVQVDGKIVGAGQAGPPLVVAVRTETGGEADESLFQHLDLNGDGVLTADELRKARETLAPLDADDDETISIAELVGSLQKRGSTNSQRAVAVGQAASLPPQSRGKDGQAGGSGGAAVYRLPLLIVGPDVSAESVAGALGREYGSGPLEWAGRRLDAPALGLSPEDVRPFDRDGDGRLSVDELAKFVLEMPPQLELSFQLFDQRRGRPHVSIAPAKHPPAYEWKQTYGDAGTLVVNGLKVELSAKRTRASSGDMSSFYALRFNIVDKDKNNYLDKQEFAALGLPAADFAAIDANGDGQIVLAELTEYFKKKTAGASNRVVVTVADESKTLFDFLDTRPDGRLSPRELNAAATRLGELDRNHDGKLTQGELRTQIRIDVELKRYPETRPTMLVAVRRNQSSTTAVSRDRGPEWFLRMDRNYDGDVSWREFLGSRQSFDQLDADHDGLLSPEEAEHAK